MRSTRLIESLNSVERRAAIETGQEVDRQDINLNGKASERAALLAKAFTIEEMEAMKARMIVAAGSEESQKAAAATALIINVRSVLDEEERQGPSEGKAVRDGSGDGKRPSWRD
jgi:hypothetical protein